MTKYRPLFLFSLIFASLSAFLHVLFQHIPALAPYSMIFQLSYCVFGPVTFTIYFFAMRESLFSVQLNRQLHFLKQEEQAQQQQAENLAAVQAQEETFHAEIFEHLKTVKEHLHRSELSQAASEMEQLSDYFEQTRMHPICSDSLLNAILQDRKDLANRNHIVADYQVLLPDSLDLPDAVLSTIFFNLLDNGIESCKNAGDDKPFLTLTVQHQAGFLHINMVNSKKRDVTFDKKTTKPEHLLHGFGLTIIEDVVAQYDGSCEWIDNGDTFQSLVMLRADILSSKE